MSCHKRKAQKEESDVPTPSPSKRGCFYKESPSPSKKISAAEKSSHVYSDEENKRVVSILEAEFDKELEAKENEIIEIQERILKTQRILQYLCYAVVSDFYSREKTITSVTSTRQRRIHPAVKKLLSGKGPPGAPELPRNVTIPADGYGTSSNIVVSRNNNSVDDDILASVDSPKSSEGNSEKEKKIPRYIPPKPKVKANAGTQSQPFRGGQNKVKTILVVGNVSKWFPPDTREDAASHKWMVYVRGPKDAPDISSFVSKVRFFLHPSYRPNDVVQVVCPPFQLSRRGWGEFPIRVQVHFSNSLNKPVDIIHNLKLDRTYSGLQTLGAETVAEVWLHREKLQSEISPESKIEDEPQKIKAEPVEDSDISSVTRIEEPNQNIISASQSLASSSNKVSDTSSQNIGQDSKKETALQIPKPPEIGSVLQTNRPLVIPRMQDVMSPSVSLPQNLQDSSAIIPLLSKSMTESLSEGEHPAMPVLAAPISTASCIAASKPVVFSPSKVMPIENILKPSASATMPVQKLQLSPAKSGSVNSAGSNQVPQKIQVSPTKPGTQLVKCVDSKGNVRILQVRTDLMPKLLKGNTSTTQASTSLAKGSPVKIVVTSSSTSTASPAVQPQTVVNSAAVRLALTTPPKTLGLQAGATISPRGLAPGVRQVLRLVRPAGDTNATPMLVAANPVVQPRAGIPLPPGNGNRPLLVMKDGKLFMMKSAIPTSGVATAVSLGKPESVSNSVVQACSLVPNSTTESKQNVIVKSLESTRIVSSAASKTTVARSIDPCVSTHLTTVMTKPLTTSNFAAVSSNLGKAVDVNLRENVSGIVKSHQQILSLNPGNIQKPLSSISVPPVIRLPSPKAIINNDLVVRSMNKSDLVSLPQGTLGLLPTPKITVKPGKSLLKSSVSLLKSNVGVTPAVNKIAPAPAATTSSSSLLMLPPPLVPPLTTSTDIGATVTTTTGVKRIILGRTSGPSTITATSQRALVYRELLGSVVRSCPKDMEDVLRALRWLIKNLPLINSEAKHPEFRILHPYCAPDEKTFCSWNIGKQRACEWLRAKTARSLLKDAGWNLQKVLSTREIVLWARFHGYTPGLPEEETIQPRTMPCGGGCENPIKTISDFGEIAPTNEWLAAQEVSLTNLSSLTHGLQVSNPADEFDEEVDIVSTVISPSKVKIKQESCGSTSKYDCEEIPLDSSLRSIGEMVTNSLKRCGISFSPEEIVPGVLYPAVQRVLIQAVQSLVEDLTRRALADAWGQNISRRPGSIETVNVCGAICHRPELDIFTCAGLGITSPDSSFLPSKKASSKKSQSSSKDSKSSKNIKRT